MSEKAARLHADALRADTTASDAWTDLQALNDEVVWPVGQMLPELAADRHRRVGK